MPSGHLKMRVRRHYIIWELKHLPLASIDRRAGLDDHCGL
jgi:hypothetical protein